MHKKKHIDFVLHDDKYETIIFRFYPRQSSCHSFGDNPPTSWSEVYKVYYSYSVIKKYKDNKGSRVLFNCFCDECSIIDEVAARCAYLADGKRSVEVIHPITKEIHKVQLLKTKMFPSGYGIVWEIRRINSEYFEFTMFDNFDYIGYRFHLHKKKIREFGKFLEECCEYMLTHGDPI